MEYLSGLGLESGWEDSNHRIAGPSSPLSKDLESFYAHNQPPLSKQPYVLLVDTSKAFQVHAIDDWQSLLCPLEVCHLTVSHATKFTDGTRLHRISILFGEATNVSLLGSSTAHLPSTIFQLAWALLLRQHTRPPTLIFGSVISDRDVPVGDILSDVRPLLNVLACCVRIQDEDPIGSLLDKWTVYRSSIIS